MWIESARPPVSPDRCVLCLVCVGVCPAAQCDRWTHSDTERTCRADSIHTATTGTTTLDRCACLSTTAATQARQTGTHAPRPHAATLYTSQNNFFTKRHTTRVIYRLTVQTLPDVCGTVYRLDIRQWSVQATLKNTFIFGLEIAAHCDSWLSCAIQILLLTYLLTYLLIWRAVWIGHNIAANSAAAGDRECPFTRGRSSSGPDKSNCRLLILVVNEPLTSAVGPDWVSFCAELDR